MTRVPLAVAMVLAVLAAPAAATMLARRAAPDELARDAKRIVHARVLDVRSGRDGSGLPATWITLDVARSLKGDGAPRFVLKQYGVAAPLADGTLTRIAGLPRYAPGEEVVLFLHGESARGFSSPVGLGQGVYRVERTRGRALVRADAGGAARSLAAFLDEVARLAAK